MSILPPESITPTFLPLNRLSAKTAANPKLPLNSTTILVLYASICEASTICLSDTSIISSRLLLITWKVLSPRPVRTPSAMVMGGNWGTSWPDLRERQASRARYGSTPIALALGLKQLRARTVPEASPPPPTGNTTQSKSATSSKISLATVAAPAMTSQSLQGCTSWAASLSATALLASYCSLAVGPLSTTSAPQPLTAFFFTLGVSLGITILVLSPSSPPTQATACP